MVYFDEASIEAYLRRHGYGVVARAFYRIFYRIVENEAGRTDTSKHPKAAKVQL